MSGSSEAGSEHEHYHHHRGGGHHGGGHHGGDLASRSIILESKRFYLDVKENSRGRFIKIAEISSDGRKNQILMTMPTAKEFRKHLLSMMDYNQELDHVDPEHITPGELRSEVMFKEDKKYHIDLKENARGRFLKVSETFTRGASRFQIFIPAEGMEELNLHLKELIDEFDNGELDDSMNSGGASSGGGGGNQNRHIKIENGNFYFSCKKNAQGRYINVSEVKGNFRNSILIPESGWDSFRQVFEEYTQQCKDQD